MRYANELLRDWRERTGALLVVPGELWSRLQGAGADMSLVQTQERAMLGLGPLERWREVFLTLPRPTA